MKNDDSTAKMRLDKWLWAARFYKTRSLAKQAIEGGKVHVNGSRAKPGREPRLDDEIKLRQGWDEKTVIIRALSDVRRTATEAQQLYEETPESIRLREEGAAQRKALRGSTPVPEKRPDKKQRRDLEKLRQQNLAE